MYIAWDLILVRVVGLHGQKWQPTEDKDEACHAESESTFIAVSFVPPASVSYATDAEIHPQVADEREIQRGEEYKWPHY